MSFRTNRVIINGFREHVADKAKPSDESGWSARLIYRFLLAGRNRLLFEKMRDKQYPISELNAQTLSCVSLDEIPINECPCEPEADYKFLRSVYPIPHFIADIRSVNSGTRTSNYDYVEWDKFRHKLSSRFESERRQPYWSMRRSKVNGVDGNYVYIYNDSFKEHVTITAVFSDPLEAFNFPDCTGKIDKCFSPLDKEFIIDEQLILPMYNLAFQELLRTKAVMSDIVNNNQDDIVNNPAPIK